MPGTGGARHAATPGRTGVPMRLPDVLDEQWFPRRCLRSFFEMQGLDRAMVIASQAFTALIPLIILASALLPEREPRLDGRRDRAQVRPHRRRGDVRAHGVRSDRGGDHRPDQHPAAGLLGGQPDPADPADVPRGLAAAAQPERARLPLRRHRAGRPHPRAGAAVGHPLPPAPDPVRLGAGAERVAGVERHRVDVHPVVAAQPTGRLAAAAARRHPRGAACAPCGATSPRCTCRA